MELSFFVVVVVQLFRAQMAISLYGLFKLWQQQSTVCWSHRSFLWQSGLVEVERGICFFLVSGCMVEGGVSGLSVAGSLEGGKVLWLWLYVGIY